MTKMDFEMDFGLALPEVAQLMQNVCKVLNNMDLAMLDNIAHLQIFTKNLTLAAVAVEKILPVLKAIQGAGVGAPGTSTGPRDDNNGAFLIPVPMNIPDAAKDMDIIGVARQMVKMKLMNSGYSLAQYQQAYDDAETVRLGVGGTTRLGNLNELYNLNGIFKNHMLDMEALPILLKAATRAGEPTHDNPDMIYKTATHMAEIAKNSPAVFNPVTKQLNLALLDQLANGVANVSLMTDGNVTASQFLHRIKTVGSPVMRQMATASGFAALAPMVLALKGMDVAPTLTALGQAFQPETLTPQGVSLLKSIGVVPGGALYNAHPAAWLDDKLIPELEQHGYKTNAAQEGFLEAVLKGTKFLPQLQDLMANLSKIESNAQDYKEVAGNKKDSFTEISHISPVIQTNRLVASVNAFMGTLDSVAVPQAINMLNSMTKLIDAIDVFATKYPHIAETITGLGVGLAGLEAAHIGVGIVARLPSTLSKIGAMARMAAGLIPVIASLGDVLVTAGAGFLTALGPVGWVTLGLVAAGVAAYHYRKDLEKIPHLLSEAGQGMLAFFHRLEYIATHPLVDLQHLAHDLTHANADGSPSYMTNHKYQPYNGVHMPAFTPSEHAPRPVYLVGENHVTVLNSDDIHRSTAGALARYWSVQAGPTGHNAALTMPLPSGSMR